MIETPETCEAYIRRCQSWSNRIHSGDFPDDIRAEAINDVCSKFDSFIGEEFKNNFPKPTEVIYSALLKGINYTVSYPALRVYAKAKVIGCSQNKCECNN